jgi:hypothetical protein
MPCRHLLERANLTACLSLSHTASELAANYADHAVMGELYADVLMNLTTAYAAYGQRQLALKFAEMHMTQRIKVERALNRTPDSEMSFEAMAHYRAVAWLDTQRAIRGGHQARCTGARVPEEKTFLCS